jgi:flagellar biosynthesis protein FlhG
MKDQAEKLRERVLGQNKRERAMLIAVTSGKGGVGKSNFALNFALSLIEQGKRTLLFDLDLGFANIDVLLGFSPRYTIANMLEDDLTFKQIVEHGPHGLLLVAGASGLDRLIQLSAEKIDRLLLDLESLEGEVDYILLDTGAGLSTDTLPLLLASDEIILVTTPEPTSLTDAYTVLKTLSKNRPDLNIKLVVNRCSHALEGLKTAQRIQTVAKQFLDQDVHYLGYLVQDQSVQQAVIRQQPFLYLYPTSKASQAVRLMAAQYLNRPLSLPKRSEGGLGGLFKRLMGSWKRSTG